MLDKCKLILPTPSYHHLQHCTKQNHVDQAELFVLYCSKKNLLLVLLDINNFFTQKTIEMFGEVRQVNGILGELFR